MLLKEYLERTEVEVELQSVLFSIAEAIKEISRAIRFGGDVGKNGTHNDFGEEQLALDVFADNILTAKLRANQLVGLIASEEMHGEYKLGEGPYAVCSDPLDGSSLVDVNLAVGTIVGVYKAKSFIGVKGDDQVASLAAVYGPRTTMVLTAKKGTVEFTLDEDGEFVLSHEKLQVGEGKMFAPGNLRAVKDRPAYLDLLKYWANEQYTLRYSGGMVPDVVQIMIKGKGIFAYPGTTQEPDGKLRLLFECAPMALLMEQAGGAASDGKMRILEKEVVSVEQRTPVFIGSKEEVKRCEQYLG